MDEPTAAPASALRTWQALFTQLTAAGWSHLNAIEKIDADYPGLRLDAVAEVAREALLRCAITASSGFGVVFGVSCVGGHRVLLCSVRVSTGCRMPKRT